MSARTAASILPLSILPAGVGLAVHTPVSRHQVDLAAIRQLAGIRHQLLHVVLAQLLSVSKFQCVVHADSAQFKPART